MNKTRRAIAEAHQAGTCLQAELTAELDQLATKIRVAMEQQRQAGYVTGRYVHDHATGDAELLEAKKAAQAEADEAVTAAWVAFYAMAGSVQSTRTSCSCSTKMAEASERGQA